VGGRRANWRLRTALLGAPCGDGFYVGEGGSIYPLRWPKMDQFKEILSTSFASDDSAYHDPGPFFSLPYQEADRAS
jgi:hypothetical protein